MFHSYYRRTRTRTTFYFQTCTKLVHGHNTLLYTYKQTIAA